MRKLILWHLTHVYPRVSVQAVEVIEDDQGREKEQPVFIDHDNFYEGRLFGELKSRAAVHLEVNLKTLVFPVCSLHDRFSRVLGRHLDGQNRDPGGDLSHRALVAPSGRQERQDHDRVQGVGHQVQLGPPQCPGVQATQGM